MTALTLARATTANPNRVTWETRPLTLATRTTTDRATFKPGGKDPATFTQADFTKAA